MRAVANKETTEKWRQLAKGLLKAEIVKRNLSYTQVAEKLKEIGVETDGKTLGNKIARGAFGADFMLQVLWAVGCSELDVKFLNSQQVGV